MRRPIGHIAPELFQNIVAQLEQNRPITLKIGGTGEVALHPHFESLMSMVGNRGIRVYVYTNGSLLRRFSHGTILEWNIDTLVVSVDGTDSASYNFIRAGGDYQLLRRQLEAFHALRGVRNQKQPRIEIRHTIMPNETAKQLLDFRKSWLMTADTVKFNYLVPLQKFLDPVAKIEAGTRLKPSCRHIRREFCTEWDGRVRFCGVYPEYLGDLHDSSIQELWHSSKAQFVRDCQERRDFDQIPVCKDCPF